MHIALIVSRLRVEEKLLIAELDKRGVSYSVISDSHIHFDIHQAEYWQQFDVVVDRCISHSRAMAALNIIEGYGVPTVNRHQVGLICGDKIQSSVAFKKAQIPQPELNIAFTHEEALKAIETMGYPVVLKPITGSWGRLMAKVSNRDAAESILEHKTTLGGIEHAIFYIQEYVEKPGQDIRIFVIGDRSICAVKRISKHWITNTSRGAWTEGLTVSETLNDLCVRAAHAVGGGILAIDVFESERGFLVNEVNYTMEYRNSIAPTGVNIPAHMLDYILTVGEGGLSNSERSVAL